MQFDSPLRDLGAVTVEPLRDAILAQEEDAWRENQFRQNEYKVHSQTETIVMIFCSDDNWPNLDVTKEAGWDRLSAQALPLMHDIIERGYPKGGTIIRAMAAKLKAGGRIMPHIDHLGSFRISHRIHIPITTNKRVRFMLDGRPHQMEVGRAYEINNQMTHGVINSGNEDRIHFIFDYAPPTAPADGE
ncbi:MAG: aspartyl/asparaginyl beta-hydroxylase domain-containing protein [Parvularculaceae bacterium]